MRPAATVFFPQSAGFQTEDLGPALARVRHGGVITSVGPPGLLQLERPGGQLAQSSDVVQTLGFVQLFLTTTARLTHCQCSSTQMFTSSGSSLR